GNDGPEALGRPPQRARHLEAVSLPDLDGARLSVALEVARRRLERRRRGVHRDHLARSAARRVKRPFALIAEQVEHALAAGAALHVAAVEPLVRSEEHTSELQSPDHLVCRLLLEKKKEQIIIPSTEPSRTVRRTC